MIHVETSKQLGTGHIFDQFAGTNEYWSERYGDDFVTILF